VELSFNQPAQAIGTQIRVTGPDGSVVSAGPARLLDTTVSQELQGALPAGRYVVAWRVTSADGHPVVGEFSYTALAAGSGEPTPSEPRPTEAAHAGHGGSHYAWLMAAAILALLAVSGGVVVARRRTTAQSPPSDDED
jgi:hypothetical protein